MRMVVRMVVFQYLRTTRMNEAVVKPKKKKAKKIKSNHDIDMPADATEGA
jgi:hypothetical protein